MSREINPPRFFAPPATMTTLPWMELGLLIEYLRSVDESQVISRVLAGISGNLYQTEDRFRFQNLRKCGNLLHLGKE
jgi:hypothetical protein